jgi:hypothetical protein
MRRRATIGSYEIRVRGRFDDHRVARLAEFTDKLEVSETVLSGDMHDQAELHGLLARLQELGFELLAVRQDRSSGAASRVHPAR